MKKETICPTCKGSGTHPLADELEWTYKRLLKCKVPVTTDHLLEVGLSPNAIMNRMKALEKLGLAERTGKQGKFNLWRAKK